MNVLIWIEIGGIVIFAFFFGMISAGARDWRAFVGAFVGLTIAVGDVIYSLGVAS